MGRLNGPSSGADIANRGSHCTLSPRPVRARVERRGRPVLFTRIAVTGSKGRDRVTVRVEYEANLMARRLVTSKIRTQPLDLSRPFPKPIDPRPEPIQSTQENTMSQ